MMRSSGAKPHSARACGASTKAGVDQNDAMPRAVAPSRMFWTRRGDGVAVLVVERRLLVRRAPDHEHVGRARVLGARLLALALVAEVAVDHVGDEGLAEPGAGVAGERGEPPRPRLLVVRRPGGQLAQLVDHVGRHHAVAVDQHVGAAGSDEGGEGVVVHAPSVTADRTIRTGCRRPAPQRPDSPAWTTAVSDSTI